LEGGGGGGGTGKWFGETFGLGGGSREEGQGEARGEGNIGVEGEEGRGEGGNKTSGGEEGGRSYGEPQEGSEGKEELRDRARVGGTTPRNQKNTLEKTNQDKEREEKEGSMWAYLIGWHGKQDLPCRSWNL
jgi:hypothetical protein